MAIKYMVFAGGGSRGLAYIGFLRAFDWLVGQCRGFAGASIGAFVALACAIGVRGKDLENVAEQFSRGTWFSPNVFEVSKRWGLDNGDGLQRFVEDLLESKGYPRTVTFSGLPKSLVVVVAKPEVCETLFLDERSDVPVAVGVRASMSLMPFFGPTRFRGEIWCDGGITCNFPLHVFPKAETLGVCVHQPRKRTITNFQDYFSSALSLLSHTLEAHYNSRIGAYHVAEIQAPAVPTVSLPLQDSARHLLLASGLAVGMRILRGLCLFALGHFFAVSREVVTQRQ